MLVPAPCAPPAGTIRPDPPLLSLPPCLPRPCPCAPAADELSELLAQIDAEADLEAFTQIAASSVRRWAGGPGTVRLHAEGAARVIVLPDAGMGPSPSQAAKC